MRTILFSLTIFLLLTGCIQNQPTSKNKSSTKNQSEEMTVANYCDCQIIHRDDGTDVTQCISLPVASDNSLEIGLAIASNGVDRFVTVTIRFFDATMQIRDDLSIRLKDNSLLTFQLVNNGLSYIGNNQVAQGVFNLDYQKTQKLKSSDLMTISIKLEDNLVHTLECSDNISILKEQLLCTTTQSRDVQIYRSNKYNYEITVPNTFKRAEATGKHIDLKLIKSDGTSIIVNISDRVPEEYGISAHDYTKEFLENSFIQYSPDIQITKTEKTFIDNNKAFLIHYINPSNSTKALEIYFFKGDYAYVLTATSKSDKFDENEITFLEIFYSLKF
jgi:hypothetical protein